jgi:hypothetical protein
MEWSLPLYPAFALQFFLLGYTPFTFRTPG